MSAFDHLLEQIDAFIRKYYKNQIIKGILLFLGVLLLTYLLVVTLEYFGRFDSVVRASLLFGFLAVNGFILVRYLGIPLARLKSFGKRIDRYQASNIIGSFFPNVSDRLLNTLQLHDQMDHNSADFELLAASVQQRSAAMSVVPFSDAIDIKENRKYLVWVAPLVGVVLMIGLFAPWFFTQGTERVIHFSQEFEIPAPFKFLFLNEKRSVEEGQNYPFELELVGDQIPEKVYVKTDQGRALLKRVTKNKFRGELVQVRNKTNLQFEANDFRSEAYQIDVIGKTSIGKMQASIVYPSYLGMDPEVIENASDLVVPEGTTVSWSLVVKNSKEAEFWLGEEHKRFDEKGFKVTKEFKTDCDGKVILSNIQSGKRDTTNFRIEVVKDNFPSINVEETKDSLKDGVRYFSGMVGDDHGLSGLNFVYTIKSKEGKERTETMKVGGVKGTESPFTFAVDFRREDVQLEDKIEYYFVVFDNDGVNGSKSTRSRSFVYKLPTLEELNDKRENEQEQTKEDLSRLSQQMEQFREELKDLQKDLKSSKKSNWNNLNQVEQLKEQQKAMTEELRLMEERMENSVQEKNQLSEIDKELLEQQQMIEQLLEELMDDELKDLLDQLEELMKMNDKEKMEDAMDQLEMSSEEMKRQMDRSLEMLKRMQVNEKIDDLEEELKQLAEEQEKLSEEMENKKNVSEEDKKKQEEINDKFDQLKDDLNRLDSLNQELKSPMELGDPKEDAEEISDELEKSSEQLEKNKSQKASESQKSAAEQMKQMAEQMDMMQQQSNQQQQAEDMDALRNILESLVTLSFDQEDVMNRLQRVMEGDPAFKKYSRVQRRIIDDTKIVRDSLYSLAERQPKIASFVDKELKAIASNQMLSLSDLDEFQENSRRRDLGVHQQYVMTSYNNLALLLNESLQQMQAQMQSMMQGSGACNKPGGSGMPKPGQGMSSGNMKEMLKKQLEQMQKGSNPGGEKPGDAPGTKPGQSGNNGLGLGSKEVAKMAAEQSAIRKRLEELRNELNKEGQGKGNGLNPLIKELEEQEKNLLNKQLDNNLIKRQKEILTRLLESEKALMERGFEEKRESNEGKNENYGNQIRFEEYNREKLKQIELLRSVDPSYKKYYKDRANEYFIRLL